MCEPFTFNVWLDVVLNLRSERRRIKFLFLEYDSPKVKVSFSEEIETKSK